MLQGLVVLGLFAALLYLTIRSLSAPRGPEPMASRRGHWRVGHHDVRGETRVVVEKLSLDGSRVLDEHLIASLRVDDPDYDAKFLAAMSEARERQALFESEETD